MSNDDRGGNNRRDSDYGDDIIRSNCANLSLHAEVYIDAAGVVKKAFAFASRNGTIIQRVDIPTLDEVSVSAAFMMLAMFSNRILDPAMAPTEAIETIETNEATEATGDKR